MEITRAFIQDDNRYTYDRGICSVDNGYAQVDTGQEAWYYGLWANASTFTIVCFAEGDLTTEQYAEAKEFEEAFKAMAERHHQFGWTCNIDTMLSDQIKDAFEAVNLSEFFWENQRETETA
jgi:hypothetical protein